MVGEAADALLDTVPLDVLTLFLEAEVHGGLIGEDALGKIGVWLRGEVDVEDALRPALRRPALALAEVVDGSPVGEADDL